MRVVAAPDKLRGTATAREVAAAIGRAAAAEGWTCDEVPMADGGEGTLEAFGGANRTTTVTAPLGGRIDAGWRLDGRLAVIEVAQVVGLERVGGPEANDPVAAATVGVGELIVAALDNAATRIVVGLGGSATTDGGLGALRAMHPLGRLKGVELVAACDALVPFLDAATVFAAQKGATRAQVELLRRRLERLAQVYREEHGMDVLALPGAGAAGGLGGGLAVAGAELVSGFDLLADELRLDEVLEGADLVVTAEGFLDEGSFDGKVVGGVASLAGVLGVPVLAIAGQVLDGMGERIDAISLVDRVGEDRAWDDTVDVIEAVARQAFAERS